MDEPRASFERFVVGANNRLAVAAARAVAESPGSTYNPLFIYGAHGLGKSHLLGAVAEHAVSLWPELEVLREDGAHFASAHAAALASGELDAFLAGFERTGMLLVDDMQQLEGHPAAQVDLAHVVDALVESGRQVVLAADRQPSGIEHFDEALLRTVSQGLQVDVSAPDYETRSAILRRMLTEQGLTLAPEVVEDLAKREYRDIAELRDALAPFAAAQQRPAPQLNSGEFESFLGDIQVVVQQHVESWRGRLREAIAYWQAEGYRTGVLERALELPRAPDVTGLTGTFSAAVEHLRNLERQARQVDPSLVGHAVFRDPERMLEAEDLVERALAGDAPAPGPSPAFAREAFEVGASNQLAVHAADAVVAEPAVRYNPLVLYGPSGVGKTHLVNAIGNALLDGAAAGAVVACVNAQQLVDELIDAVQQGTVDQWRARYRSASALIVDDIQFLGGKERTQEEFFAVFNALIDARKQVILTSDRVPADITDLESRLRSRFEGGLVVPIQSPDRALRERLFARFLHDAGRTPGEDVLHALGEPPVQSVREIIGAVHRLSAASASQGEPITVELVRRELGGVAAAMPTPTMVPAVQDAQPFLDLEKVVWDWPDVGARLIEEVR
ncbi:MAG: DnaA/Hda family protein [Gemmatimonadaceae bacterium]